MLKPQTSLHPRTRIRTSPRVCVPHRLNQHGRLAIQDGSKSESGAQKKWNPEVNLFACRFHIKQELIRRGAAGAPFAFVTERTVHRGRRHVWFTMSCSKSN